MLAKRNHLVWPNLLLLHSSEREREMGGGQLMKRIPRIKFPQRHPKSSTSAAAKDGDAHEIFISKSEVPAAPTNTATGGKASLQPKRTPVTDKEIEAVLLGGCF